MLWRIYSFSDTNVCLDSSSALNWYLIGRAYMETRKYNKAHEAYQQAVYRDGRDPVKWISIGILYYRVNQFRDALDAYSRAIRLDPYIYTTWLNLGILYEVHSGQIVDARDLYTRAHELNPENQAVKEQIDVISKHMQDPTIVLSRTPLVEEVHPLSFYQVS
jgi:glucose repression mediator protein